MAAKSKSLKAPPAAGRDPKATEMMRVWVAEAQLQIALRVGVWHDAGRNEGDAWGIVLADTARHVANALESEYGQDHREVLNAINESFEREMLKPTSPVRGKFV